MPISVPEGDVFQVRIRFTNGKGSYSLNYTTSSVSLAEDDDPIVSFPLNDSLSSEDISGILWYDAASSEDYVVLTEDAENNYGVLVPGQSWI